MTFQIETNRHPVRALADATARWSSGLYRITVRHDDDGCPCVTSRRSLAACTCDTIELNVVRKRGGR